MFSTHFFLDMPSPILFQLATLEVRSKAEKISHLIIKNWGEKNCLRKISSSNMNSLVLAYQM